MNTSFTKQKSSISSNAKVKKLADIPIIKFKNPQDLMYDYGKFTDCSITQVFLELHGNNLKEKTADLMRRFLQSVQRVDKLYLNLSISSITNEYLNPISEGLKNLIPTLKHVEVDLSRSKVESEAFEYFCSVLGECENLHHFAINAEK